MTHNALCISLRAGVGRPPCKVVHWLAKFLAAKNSESRAGCDGAAPARKVARLCTAAVIPPSRWAHSRTNRRTRLPMSLPSGGSADPTLRRTKSRFGT